MSCSETQPSVLSQSIIPKPNDVHVAGFTPTRNPITCYPVCISELFLLIEMVCTHTILSIRVRAVDAANFGAILCF